MANVSSRIFNRDFNVIVTLVWSHYTGGATLRRGGDWFAHGPEGTFFQFAWIGANRTITPTEMRQYGCQIMYGTEIVIGANHCGEVPYNEKPNCFVPGTPVVMADGKLRAIEEVRLGDLVRSACGVGGADRISRVMQISSELADRYLRLHLSDNTTLSVSPRQAIVTEAGPVPAGYITEGARLYPTEEVKVISVENVESSTTLHCLYPEGDGPFFVNGTVPIQVRTGDKNCLLIDTPVLMADGSTKFAGEISTGDRLALSGATIKMSEGGGSEVRQVSQSIVPMYMEITFSNDFQLKCSTSHSILTLSGPVRAGEIFIGAQVRDQLTGNIISVSRAEGKLSEARVVRLDLAQEGSNYIIGDAKFGILAADYIKP